MFSRQIVCAIYVLNELSAMDGLYGKKLGLTRCELNSLMSMKSVSMSRALQKLRSCDYIHHSESTGRYCMKVNIEEISVLDLVRVLHGGLVVGEERELEFIYGNFNSIVSNSDYSVFVEISSALKKKIEDEFSKIHVSDLAKKVTPYLPLEIGLEQSVMSDISVESNWFNSDEANNHTKE